MAAEQPGPRRFTVTVEVLVEVHDAEAVERAALTLLEKSRYLSQDGAADRADERRSVREDLGEALTHLANGFAILGHVPGVEIGWQKVHTEETGNAPS